jgi:hypothetical protein
MIEQTSAATCQQHNLRTCAGGHFTEPNEQYTQQSPAFGRSSG